MQSVWWYVFAVAVCVVLSCQVFGTRRTLWLPLLVITAGSVAVELAGYLLIRQFVTFVERILTSNVHERATLQQMHQASSYNEWKEAAQRMDRITNRDAWKYTEVSKIYDWKLIGHLKQRLQDAKRNHDVIVLMETLHTAMQRNVGGIYTEMLYSKSFYGTKVLVEEFVEEVISSFHYIMSCELTTSQCLKALRIAEAWSLLHQPVGSMDEDAQGESKVRPEDNRRSSLDANVETDLLVLGESVKQAKSEELEALREKASWNAKLKLLKVFQMSFGEPALCLSGGAGLACYHLGVVKALMEQNLLPKIISGTSAGACFAGLIGTHTDEELKKIWYPEHMVPLFTPFEEPMPVIGKRFVTKGHMFDAVFWHKKIVALLGGKDLTFLEAFNRTGRILNITTTSSVKYTSPMVLNYVSAPNVLISSAILASTAIPFLIKPVKLKEKGPHGEITERSDGSGLWRDGSFEVDIPVQPLSEVFRARFFIVSQTNPHIIPFFFYHRGESGRPSPWRQRTGAWRGGYLLSALEFWLKEDMKKNLRVMQRLDLLPPMYGQDWSNLFLQEFHGDVTIIPRPAISDYLGILSNPDLKSLTGFFDRGSRYTWRKMSMISNRIRVNQALDTCIAACHKWLERID
jgi:predicted acylesterase/phospholipase RssA